MIGKAKVRRNKLIKKKKSIMRRQLIYLGCKLRNNLNKLLKMNIFNERTMDLRLLLVTLATKSLPYIGKRATVGVMGNAGA